MIPDTDIEVRKSRIGGRGVFALRDFEAGETVIVWDTTNVLSDDEYARLPEDQKVYVARYQGTWLYMMPPARYVNHSCEANTDPIAGADVAIKHIAAGQEITSDYRTQMKQGERMDCHCGARSCKGYIEGTAL